MVRSFVRVHGGLAINSVGSGFRASTSPEVLTLLHTSPFRIRLLSVFSVVPIIVTISLNKDSAPKISRINRYLPPKRKGYISIYVYQLACWMLFTLLLFSRVSIFTSSSLLLFCSPALFAYYAFHTFARPRGEMEVSEIECVTARINIISRTIRRKFCHDRDII